jgi:HEAT repeat protein
MKRRILIAAMLLATIGVMVWLVQGPPEPSYQGEPLHVWLERYRESSYEPDGYLPVAVSAETLQARAEARAAIREMGTNALPFLLKLLGTRDSELKSRSVEVLQNLSGSQLSIRLEQESHSLAAFGFGALGPAAKPAVPALMEMLNDTNRDTRRHAAFAVGLLDPAPPEAVPALLQHLNDPHMNGEVIIALGNLRGAPELVVPALAQALGQPNRMIPVQLTVMALGKYGGQAKAAVPALLPLLQDPNRYVRTYTFNALEKIDPEAAAKARAEQEARNQERSGRTNRNN